MNARTTALVAILLAIPSMAGGQVIGRQAADGCVSVAEASSRVTVEGRLTLQLFAGPPDYESIANGDAEERTFILELSGPACIDDGGEFADPGESFRTVHVSVSDDALRTVLSASLGRQVTVSGEGLASHTGHHRAPLVVLADRIIVR